MAKTNMTLKINSFPTDYEHSMKLSFQNSSQQITESGHTRQVTLQRIDEKNIESKELHKRWTL